MSLGDYDSWKLATPPEYEDDSTCYTCSRRPCICGELFRLKKAREAAEAAERCNACGELECEVCGSCTDETCEGRRCVCASNDLISAEAIDGAIDDAKVAEVSAPAGERS